MYLEEAYVVRKVPQYSTRAKRELSFYVKLYDEDVSFNTIRQRSGLPDLTHNLENIVYLELIRRGYKVDIGKVNETEIDFVARKQDCIEYYQVSFTVNSSADTLRREVKPFEVVNDHYQKFLITMDKDFVSDIDGIRKLYAVDWLLES